MQSGQLVIFCDALGFPSSRYRADRRLGAHAPAGDHQSHYGCSYAARAPAIDVHDFTSHETCALGAEEKDHRGDFLRCSDATKRYARNSAAIVLIGRNPARTYGGVTETSPARRINRSGVYAGNEDVVLGALFGQRLGEVQQPRID